MKNLRFRTLICTLAAIILLSSVLSSCSSTENDFTGSPEEFIYTQAAQALENYRWGEAIALFQQLEAQFPFGQYAAQAQIELVYAYYRSGQPEAARAAADRFIRLYPDDENIDYAYYMKGMAFYSEDASFITRFLPADPTKRDPGMARESFADFSQLVSRFPNSPYAADARARMVYLRNLLAAYEINVAEFYIRRQAYLSSLNRARYVVESYQGSPSVPRAMEIMVEMYMRLGLEENANRALAVLKENYPDSPMLDENGEFIVSTQITDPSLLYSLTFGLLGSNKKDTPIAPTKRPSEMAATMTETRSPSLLNVLTLGTFGDEGAPPPAPDPNEPFPNETE